MRGKRADKLSVDKVVLRTLLETSGLRKRRIASDIGKNPSSVQRFFEKGTGDAVLVNNVLGRLGVARSDIPRYIKQKDVWRRAAPLPTLSTPVNHRLLESLFMVGKLDFVRGKIVELRSSKSENAEWADLMEAELLKWTGDFAHASRLYKGVAQSSDSFIKVHALAGQLRIARQLNNNAEWGAVIEQLNLLRPQLPLQLREYFRSFFQSLRAMKLQSEGERQSAIDSIVRAQGSAHKSHLRIEPLKRMIERAIILRKEHLQTRKAEDAEEAVAHYFAAFASAESMNCFTYMSSALNGVARISEQEATNAEQSGDSTTREARLLEADSLLRQACEYAELAENASMIAIAIGCRAIVKRRLGDFDQAITLSERSIDIERRIGRLAYAKIDEQNMRLAKIRSTVPIPRQ